MVYGVAHLCSFLQSQTVEALPRKRRWKQTQQGFNWHKIYTIVGV